MNVTSIPAPRVPFIDERTGLISREWYRFFLNLFTLTGSGTTDASWTDLQIAPATQPVMVDVDLQGMGSVCPVCQGVTLSDDAALTPGTPEQRVQDLIIPSYPEQTPFDVLAPTSPVGFTQRVESLMSDVQGLTLAPPLSIPMLSNKRGGIRKVTTTQTIGNLGASWVAITNYDASAFATNSGDTTNITKGVIINLTNGTITPTEMGDYMVTVNVSTQFTADNNSTRIYGLRVYDVTASAPVTNVDTTIFVGAYLSGDTSSISLPCTIGASIVNHALRIEVGAGSAFTSFAIPNATFAMHTVGIP